MTRNASSGKFRRISGWPKTVHLYRCAVCGKQFEHSSSDATLRAHKAPAGFVCSGRRGIYEGTK